MTEDTDRLAALLHERWDKHVAGPAEECLTCRADAARLIAQGVRVGDDGPTILDAWRVLEREYPEATVERLRAALGDDGLRAALFDEYGLNVVDEALAIAIDSPAEMEVNRERWRLARDRLRAALAAVEESQR